MRYYCIIHSGGRTDKITNPIYSWNPTLENWKWLNSPKPHLDVDARISFLADNQKVITAKLDEILLTLRTLPQVVMGHDTAEAMKAIRNVR